MLHLELTVKGDEKLVDEIALHPWYPFPTTRVFGCGIWTQRNNDSHTDSGINFWMTHALNAHFEKLIYVEITKLEMATCR
jgi:hypothetical protein